MARLSICVIFAFFSVLFPAKDVSLAQDKIPVTAIEVLSARQLITGGDNGVFVVDAESLRPITKIECSLEKISAIKLSPDKKWLAIAGGSPAESGTVELFRVSDFVSAKRFEWGDDVATDIVWQSNTLLASCNMRGTCCRLDVNGKKNIDVVKVHSKPAMAIARFSETRLVSSGADGVLKTWTDPNQVVRSLNNHTSAVNDLALRPSSLPAEQAMIASASDDGTVRFWQPSIGRMVRFVRLKSRPTCLAWNRDGSFVVSGCKDGTLHLIDVNHAKSLTQFKIKGWIHCVAISEDGATVFAGTEQGLRGMPLPTVLK